ncbi:MAG: 16S rRNA (guanine(966)-N(2))-methyltransferase RsmD [candidate division Zixibacteria bacterium]|nr:16S rRNA (guanine(966)-N(2))-methyltransferase RsmD [candidate division Zixibacteria bacterium]
MSLRIGGGFLKGRVLKGPRSKSYRPLTGRLKRSLFDYLGDTIRGAAVLDFFAGVGVFGVEALSRGAARVTFVEKDAALVDFLEDNLRSLGLVDVARVSCEDVFYYLNVTRPRAPYDVVFLDPPYGRGLAFRTIEELARWPGFGERTLGVAKTFKKERFAGPPPLALLETRQLGDDNLFFFHKELSASTVRAAQG